MHATFTLTVLDIPFIGRGVGLALVLQTPGGGTYLYDTGSGYPAVDGGWEGGLNSGRDQIAPFLEQRGIRALDGVIISHAHYDHFGGLLWLVDRVPIARLIDCGYAFTGTSDPGYTRELADYAEVRERFRQRPDAYQAVHAGDTLELDPALTVDVIAPPRTFFHEDRPEARPAEDPAAHYLLNANSLMLRIRHGNVVFLLPGDIELDDQRRYLLATVPPERLACDVMIAPGHGLHSAPEIADAARPRLTIASCHAQWADRCTARQVFAAHGGEIRVTGLDGSLSVTSDGKNWKMAALPSMSTR